MADTPDEQARFIAEGAVGGRPTRAAYSLASSADPAEFFRRYVLALSFAFRVEPERALAECQGLETEGWSARPSGR